LRLNLADRIRRDEKERHMGRLTVRKVDDEIIRRLKIRAAEHGRSAEAEHREILKQALLPSRQMAVDEWFRLAKELLAETAH
jgi:antitoxin FitA